MTEAQGKAVSFFAVYGYDPDQLRQLVEMPEEEFERHSASVRERIDRIEARVALVKSLRSPYNRKPHYRILKEGKAPWNDRKRRLLDQLQGLYCDAEEEAAHCWTARCIRHCKEWPPPGATHLH